MQNEEIASYSNIKENGQSKLVIDVSMWGVWNFKKKDLATVDIHGIQTDNELRMSCSFRSVSVSGS